MCPQPPLLEEQNEDSVIQEPDSAPQTCLASDPDPQALAAQAADEGPQASDPAPLAFESALKGAASDLDSQVVERPLQADVVVPAESMLQESDPDTEALEFPKKAGLGPPLRTPASVTPPQGPEVNIQAQLSLGEETGESVPEAPRVKQEDPESKLGPSETSLCVRLEEQGTLDQRLDLPEGQTEAREHEQRVGGLVGDATERKPQKKLEGAPVVRTREARAPGEILVSGVPEREALQEEAVRLKREAEALRADLEAQARRLEARGTEAARLSEELAQAQRAEAEAHREVETQARELARLREAVESSARELEAASREREALVEALAAVGRERRQWEREVPRLRVRAEEAEEQLHVLEGEGRRHLEEAERQRQEKQALQEVRWGSWPGDRVPGQLLGLGGY